MLFLQIADSLQGLSVRPRRFAKVCGIAVGLPVGLVAYLLERLEHTDLGRGIRSAHKAEQPLHIGTGLDVDQVHAVAAGAVGRKLVLSQQRFKIPGEVRPGGEKFQVIFLLRVGDRATAQKGHGDIGADAGLATDEPGVDLQAGLPAGCAEQLVQAGDLLRIADIELVQHTADAGLFQDLAPDAAAGKQLLRQLHRMGLLGLQHKAAGIKVFGKAGNAIGSCTHTAFLGGAALRDFLPRTGCKTHSISSVFSARHPGAAPRARSPERCSIPQACVRM